MTWGFGTFDGAWGYSMAEFIRGRRDFLLGFAHESQTWYAVSRKRPVLFKYVERPTHELEDSL